MKKENIKTKLLQNLPAVDALIEEASNEIMLSIPCAEYQDKNLDDLLDMINEGEINQDACDIECLFTDEFILYFFDNQEEFDNWKFAFEDEEADNEFIKALPDGKYVALAAL